MKPKLFIIGIDSATWILLDKWIKEKKLPNFAKLVKTGLSANLESTVPPLTPVAWSSFYTGLNPGRHQLSILQTLRRQAVLLYTPVEIEKEQLFGSSLIRITIKPAPIICLLHFQLKT